MEKNILLASFIYENELEKSLNKLKQKNLLNNKVFILRNVEDTEKLILTYNVLLEDDKKINFDDFLNKTVSLHRKRDTNTLFTLNALNELIKLENDNKLDKKHSIDWSQYKNCILVISNKNKLLKIKTILDSIEDLSERGKNE